MWLWEQSGDVLDGTEACKGPGLVKSVPVPSRCIQTRWSLRSFPIQPILWFCHSVVFQINSSAVALKADTQRINLSSCPDQFHPALIMPGPCLALLFPPRSSPLAAQCMLSAVSASAVQTDHIRHGDSLPRRWERSITSSHSSPVKTQHNKPALQLQEQFPLRAELTLPNEFPFWLLAHSFLCLRNNSKSSQCTKYNRGRMKLQVATETIWQSFGMTAFLPSSTHLAVYSNSGLQAGPYSCQPASPAGKSHGIKEGETFNTEFHWLW